MKKDNVGTMQSQSGASVLGVVAVIGVIVVIVQGSLMYKAKSGASFLDLEKNKTLAMQMAEAGIESNIADIGTRRTIITHALTDSVTYSNKTLGSGTYTSKLSTVVLSSTGDTVDLTSTGSAGSSNQTVITRLRLLKYVDTTLVPVMVVTPETTMAIHSTVVPETTLTTTIQDPAALAPINKTVAYAAFMSSSEKKANVCHLPDGDATKANVISVAKASVDTHISHHGDYISTDGTCDIYKPVTTTTITSRTVLDTTLTITDRTTYDTTVSIDTLVKTQILSWK